MIIALSTLFKVNLLYIIIDYKLQFQMISCIEYILVELKL